MNLAYIKYVLPRRRRYQAMGLRVDKRPRSNRVWPDLAGLTGREYARRFMRLRRMEAV